MPSIIDQVNNPYHSTHWTERAADTILSPIRAIGIGHEFTVIRSNEGVLYQRVPSHHSIALKIAAIVLFPLMFVSVLFAIFIKLIVQKDSPMTIEEHPTIPTTPQAVSTTAQATTVKEKTYSYPAARRCEHIDIYHGTEVADPYRWLETADSDERTDWITGQVSLANEYLQSLPSKREIRSRLKELWNYPKFSLPFREGGKFFWFKNDGLQNQSVLYTSDKCYDEPRLLLDPNKLSKDGTTALSDVAVTNDGRLMAYSYSEGGSDWVSIKVLDIESGEHLEDHIDWAKFTSINWDKDNKGFYYSRFDQPEDGKALQASNKDHQVFYHKIGTDQSEDTLVYANPEHPDWLFHTSVTDDGRYLYISVADGCKEENGVFVRDLGADDSKVNELLNAFDGSYQLAGNIGTQFYFVTSNKANHKRIVCIDLEKPEKKNWKTIIPESEHNLESATIIGGKLVAKYLQDAHTQVKVFNLDGTFIRDVELPGIGSASGFGGKQSDTETYYTFSSFTAAPTTYRYELDTGATEMIRESEVNFNPDDYETKQVFFESRDGTKIPMFISHKKGIELDGENRVMLYGYGGFNVSITPHFSVSNLVWMERGGISCVVNLRGGGEYGKEWHEAGMKLNKQNVFDDFISAGEWLVEEGYTKPSKLGIMGGSNGGLLVGACLNQAPELFGAAIPKVGVMDMLRFDQFTIGKAWTTDYGSPQDPGEFQVLRSYSPYHNIDPEKQYPAVMVTTSDHDDRVVPLHSYKYAAELQNAKGEFDEKPAIIRIATNTGHGAGRSTAELLDELSDQWAFLEKHLN